MHFAPYPRFFLSRSLAASARRVLARPAGALGLGTALLLALFGVLCGFGLLLAPWFVCELLALHLRLSLGVAQEHHRGWFGAWLIEIAAWVFLLLGGLLGTLGLGAWEVHGLGDWFLAVWPGLLGAAVGLAAMLPWLFVPPMLLDRGGSVLDALTHSVGWIATSGALRTLLFSWGVHLVQASPLLALSIGWSFSPSVRSPWWLLAAVASSAVIGVPLGQGAVVEAYRVRRDEVPRAGATLPPGFPGTSLALAAAVALAVPLLSLLLVAGAVLARPASMVSGAVEGGLLLHRARIPPGGVQVLVPGTGLTVRALSRRLVVAASDGGGAGRIPLGFEGPIEEVALYRRGERILLEVRSGEGRWHAAVDEAGVRLDDGLRRRLRERLPPPRGALLALLLLLGTVSTIRALAPLAEVLRLAALPPSLRPEEECLLERVRAARARAWRWMPLWWLQAGAVAVVAWFAWL